jgi:hydrogenase maturation protease
MLLIKTIVVGLGNPILGDDGIGIRVSRELADRVHLPDVTIVETSAAGLDFINMLAGYDRAIIIDAIILGKGPPGELYRLTIDEINSSLHSTSVHDISLGEALQLGKTLGESMPHEIIILAIEAACIDAFSEKCSPQLEINIPRYVSAVLAEINRSRE